MRITPETEEMIDKISSRAASLTIYPKSLITFLFTLVAYHMNEPMDVVSFYALGDSEFRNQIFILVNRISMDTVTGFISI